ncbi:hypothetical protein B0O99DRAFT_695196 [Bisporella sp. PMI_857]|nr:hypothetical protein B0O99DRAFT_695196 [Bisporella sp. PMI_857]
MPSTLDAPILMVDVELIPRVDTHNVENLFSTRTALSTHSYLSPPSEQGARAQSEIELVKSQDSPITADSDSASDPQLPVESRKVALLESLEGFRLEKKSSIQGYFNDDVFGSDEEDIDESVIGDDDDSSEWEDTNEDSKDVSIDENKIFQRVDSRPQLTSRRSLLTVALHQIERYNVLINHAAQATPAPQRSRISSPNGTPLATSLGSDKTPLTMKRSPLKAIGEVSQTEPQPIIMATATNNLPHPIPHSPRTTRRNMLATELTVSLRQHLLWERQQKSQTVNAVLKRRHTAHDVANQYFNQGLGEYHSKGW